MADAVSPPHPPPRPPRSVPEVAALTTLSERHVWRLITARKIRAIRFGRRVLVPPDEVDRLLREGCA